jgi:2-keto-3-deoxy-L-rhamnonate aldolase RhmA
MALLAGRAAGVATIVRVASAAPERVLAALDDGAAGILAPHIASVSAAKDLVAACRYSGKRGFSNSPRAGGYGARSVVQHIEAADAEVSVIAMIEDAEAIGQIDEIVSVEGLDAVFVGRGDLAVSMQDREPGAPKVRAATESVLRAARQAGKPVCLLASAPAEVREFGALGVTAFVISSDQGFMRIGAMAALSECKSAAMLRG